MKKYLLLIFGLLLVTSALIYLFVQVRNSLAVAKPVEIIFCDVGQGDALLVQAGTLQLMVDFGYDHRALKCLQQHMPWWDRQIELAIVTHADTDHFGGFEAVSEKYTFTEIWITNQAGSGKAFEGFVEAILAEQRSQAKIYLPSQGSTARLGSFSLEVVWPDTVTETTLWDFNPEYLEEVKDKNTGSIVGFLWIDDVCVALMGDIDTETEQALLNQSLTTKCQVLKVAHHGSNTASQQEFLTKIRPEYALIGVGEDNSYGHPTNEVLSRLEAVGTQVLRTDHEGSIRLMSDGIQVWRPE